MEVAVKLEMFEGPLDLLLHLIRKNEVDIYDIPVAMITRQYLEYLDLMREMNIQVAGEFLVMASTLTHIKSRMLLPTAAPAEDEEEEDPRLDLVEQLKEHMRFRQAAEQLEQRPWLDRDVFTRGGGSREVERAVEKHDEGELIEAGLFDLIEAFRTLLATRGETLELHLPESGVSLEQRMSQILELLRSAETVLFEECFGERVHKKDLVVTFLALLELTRLGLIRLYQQRLPGPDGRPDWGAVRIYFNPLAREEEDS